MKMRSNKRAPFERKSGRAFLCCVQYQPPGLLIYAHHKKGLVLCQSRQEGSLSFPIIDRHRIIKASCCFFLFYSLPETKKKNTTTGRASSIVAFRTDGLNAPPAIPSIHYTLLMCILTRARLRDKSAQARLHYREKEKR